MSGLRDEIIEAEKARTDLLKWKLIIVSGLGGAGLGFTGQSSVPGALYVLLLIPAVCLYVDLMCRHLTLRIMVVGTSCDSKGGTRKGITSGLSPRPGKSREKAQRLRPGGLGP